MSLDIYANIPHATQHLRIQLYDTGEDGSAVWQVSIGQDIRYVEGHINDDVWIVVDMAVNAFLEE